MHGDIGIAGDGWPHALKPAHPPSARNGSASLTENRPQVRPQCEKRGLGRPAPLRLPGKPQDPPAPCTPPAICSPRITGRMRTGPGALILLASGWRLQAAKAACKDEQRRAGFSAFQCPWRVQERARGRCEDDIASGLSDRAACSRSGRAASFIRRNAPLRAA